MGMTIAEKILAAHTDARGIKPGDIIKVNVDVALSNDITAPIAIKEFEAKSKGKLADPDKIVFVLDHFTPNKDIASANQCKMVRDFAGKHGYKNFFDGGEAGVEHALLPEKGLVVPGDMSSVRTATPAPTAHWVHSPPAWEAPTWPRPC